MLGFFPEFSSVKTTATKAIEFLYPLVQGTFLAIAGVCAIGVLAGAPIDGFLTLPMLIFANALLALLPIVYRLWARDNMDPYLFDKKVNPNALSWVWHYLNIYGYVFDFDSIKHYPRVWQGCVMALLLTSLTIIAASVIATMTFFIPLSDPLTTAMFSLALIGAVIPLLVYGANQLVVKLFAPEGVEDHDIKHVYLLHTNDVEELPHKITQLAERLSALKGEGIKFEPSKCTKLDSWTTDFMNGLSDNAYVVVYQQQENDESTKLDTVISRLLKKGVRVLRIVDSSKDIQAINGSDLSTSSSKLTQKLKTVYWNEGVTHSGVAAKPRRFWVGRGDEVLAKLARWTNKPQQQYIIVQEKAAADGSSRTVYSALSLLKNLEAAKLEQAELKSKPHIGETYICQIPSVKSQTNLIKQRAINLEETLVTSKGWLWFTKQQHVAAKNYSLYDVHSPAPMWNSLPGEKVN